MPRRGGEENDVLFMGFNQDASCVSIGTKSGYRIFNCQPFGRNIFSTEGGIGIVEMLFSTSLVALVGGGEKPAFSPRHLKLWNSKTASVICELDFSSRIQAVKMNRKRLIVVLETQLHIYDLDTMINLQTLEVATLGSGPSGNGAGQHAGTMASAMTQGGTSLLAAPLCELSPDENTSFLALPANSISGDVFLYDALNLVEFRWIQAHKARLTSLQFSQDGSMLATASETGTVIRVFRVPSGEKLYSFRRGSYSATVYSLAFDEAGDMLAASSSNGTVHLFGLTPEARYACEDGTSAAAKKSGGGSGANGNDGDGGAGAGMRTAVGSFQTEGDGTHTSPRGSSGLGASGLGSSQERAQHASSPMGRASNFFGTAASNAMALLEKQKSLAGKFLPGAISEMVEPTRSVAVARLPDSGVRTACCLGKGLVSVVTAEGHFYQYRMGVGACELAFEMSLHVSDGNAAVASSSQSSSSSSPPTAPNGTTSLNFADGFEDEDAGPQPPSSGLRVFRSSPSTSARASGGNAGDEATSSW
ncbi:Autophagy-related protein 18 [Hondaea fermentalgiana]|uniref:Autophagy-related protein 18 n=1 Tax=Hondaea fermentalgiana TaxID=2315210 RepID=A0A2R5GWZ5_9STRA|nr:Autophagy-related protein 18 [Hondaea fermentalgiana]|eukprot:GBG32931.1 Autophagy-related protein 18 [Hondaea fermentalgiana]